MLPDVRVPVQVVDHVVAATLGLRFGLQLRLYVGMAVQVRLQGLGYRLTEGGVALLLRIGVSRRQRDYQRGEGAQQTTGKHAVQPAPKRVSHGHATQVTRGRPNRNRSNPVGLSRRPTGIPASYQCLSEAYPRLIRAASE